MILDFINKDSLALKKNKTVNLDNRTILFNKKSNKTLTKTMVYIVNDTGFTRHFTPAAQEWHNSICSYNYTYYKSLPVADKNLYSLLRSYFNLHPKPKKVKVIKKVNKRNNRRNRWKNKQGGISMPIWYSRLSVYKTFIGKGNIKHTSKKVILTFYVHDFERRVLEDKLKYYKRFTLKYGNSLLKSYFYPFLRKDLLALPVPALYIPVDKRPVTFYFPKEERERRVREKALEQDKGKSIFLDFLVNLSEGITYLIPIIDEYCRRLPLFVETMPLTKKKSSKKWKKADKKILMFQSEFDIVTTRVKIIELIKKERYKTFLIMQNLSLKKLKLKSPSIWKLIYFIEKLYDKKVELNVVNLKFMHFNSDIYTQAVSLKLKNRDNKLYRVLKASLRFVKVWPIDKIVEKQKKRDKEKVLTNKIRNNLISSMITDQKVKDPLTSLLTEFFPPAVSMNSIRIKGISAFINRIFFFSLKDYILSTLKHNKLRGIRVEARGRLTRRYTASRSVFKMKWKGGLKNVDSTFRGFPAIMLRGHAKSNVQYSVINSNNRNGAYGVKGWVSSR